MGGDWNGSGVGPPPRWLVWLTIVALVVSAIAWVLH